MTILKFSVFNKLGDVSVYQTTSSLQLKDRIKDADIIIVNKIRLNKDNLTDAKKLKLICVTATGYDNIDINYCWHKGIGVCNVKGYSTDSVAQITVSMALSLASHLNEFNNYVKSGKYMISGVQNHLKPYFNELKGKTWGVIGLGNIGQRTADIAYALGMENRVKFTQDTMRVMSGLNLMNCVKIADIISVHVPLTSQTKGMIDEKRISLMKDGVIFINVSRGCCGR
mgnify:CR=1 FL=1